MQVRLMCLVLMVAGCAHTKVWVDSTSKPLKEQELIAAKQACDFEAREKKISGVSVNAVMVSRYEQSWDKSSSTRLREQAAAMRVELDACMAAKGAMLR